MLKARPLTKEQLTEEKLPNFGKLFETHRLNTLLTLPVFANRTILSPIDYFPGDDLTEIITRCVSISGAEREVGVVDQRSKDNHQQTLQQQEHRYILLIP